MDDLPQTQTQEDYVETTFTEELEFRRPWGRLCACQPSLKSIDLVEESYTLGRAPNCNIFIDKAQFSAILNVSKQHFQICREEDNVVYITDLSKNGTFVNDLKVGKNRKHIIYNDDIIAIGHPQSRIYTFNCNINHEDFDYPSEMRMKYFISKKIGRGAFGEVRLAHDKRSFQKFAIKKICKSRSASNTSGHATSQKVKTEIEILSSFSYAFIIQMLDVFETDKDVFLVLEYMQGGELTGRILSAVPFPEPEVKFVFYQILLAVRYLHLHGVTHRDLKPENVLLVSDSTYPMVKVSDFGLSKIMDETSKMETICGTINYAAPEVLSCFEPYNRKVDVWSLGVILFYMLSKTLPFLGPDRDGIARNIRAGKITWDSKAWKGVSTSAKDLTRSMLVLNPDRRLSTHEVFKKEWIEKDTHMKYKVEQFVTPTFDETDSSEETLIPPPKRPRLLKNENVSV